MVSLRNNLPEVILFIILLVFVFIKIPHIYLPLHWDEMGVYGKSVLYLLKHGISILPGDLNPELSRGHPMLLVFLTSLFVKIFGGNVIVFGHIFMVIVSLSLVYCTYQLGSFLDNKITGLLASIFLLVQPIFIAQSALILPEVLLALLTVLSIFAYLKKKWKWYFVSCSLALLTKETAIIIPVAILLYHFLIHRKFLDKALIWIVLPYSTFLLFLLIQRIQNGWFLFPYHTSLVQLDPGYIWDNGYNFLIFLFVAQGRLYFSLASLLTLLTGIVAKKYLIKDWKHFLLLSLIVLTMFTFSVINFYMNRYFMLLFPIIGIGGMIMIRRTLSGMLKWGNIILIPILLYPLFFMRNPKQFNYDVDLGYIDQTNNIVKAVRFLEKVNPPEKPVLCDFPMNFSIENARYGYLQREKSLEWTKDWEGSWEYMVLTHPSSYDISMKDSSKVVLLKTFTNRFAKSAIFKRKR